jgi:hypothetical protein
MREERKIFCIKIMDREALLVSYALGRTVAFLMLREPIGHLLWVVFCDFFFTFSQYVGKGRGYREAVVTALMTGDKICQSFLVST